MVGLLRKRGGKLSEHRQVKRRRKENVIRKDFFQVKSDCHQVEERASLALFVFQGRNATVPRSQRYVEDSRSSVRLPQPQPALQWSSDFRDLARRGTPIVQTPLMEIRSCTPPIVSAGCWLLLSRSFWPPCCWRNRGARAHNTPF